MDHLYFFGRFNFPHFGYLYVIRESLQQIKPKCGITIVFSAEDATWGKHAIALEHRLAMFRLLIRELPTELRKQVHFSTIEYGLQKKLGSRYGGYTIDTLTALITSERNTVGIVLGADALLGIPGIHPGFTDWKDWKHITKLATLVTLPRGRFATVSDIKAHLPAGLSPVILSTSPTENELHASSTAISTGNLQFLPSSVQEYALAHGLLVQ